MSLANDTTTGIVYSPEDRDFAVYYEGELVAFARTFTDGEIALSELKASIAQQRAADALTALVPDPAAWAAVSEGEFSDEPPAFKCPHCGYGERVYINGAFRCLICGADITRAVQADAASDCPACGSDGSPCVDCNPADDEPADCPDASPTHRTEPAMHSAVAQAQAGALFGPRCLWTFGGTAEALRAHLDAARKGAA